MGLQLEVSVAVLCEVAQTFQNAKLSDANACKKSAALLEELNDKAKSGRLYDLVAHSAKDI